MGGFGNGVIGFKMFLPAHGHEMRSGQVGEWGLLYLKKFPVHLINKRFSMV
jgi:hypothetical protein